MRISGQPEERKRMDPKIVQAILQDDMVRLLSKILKNQEQTIPQGIFDANGDGETFVGFRNIVSFDPPIFSISITNDGPDDAYIAVNTEKPHRLHKVKAEETHKINMPAAKIHFLFIRVPTGSATLRMPRFY